MSPRASCSRNRNSTSYSGSSRPAPPAGMRPGSRARRRDGDKGRLAARSSAIQAQGALVARSGIDLAAGSTARLFPRRHSPTRCDRPGESSQFAWFRMATKILGRASQVAIRGLPRLVTGEAPPTQFLPNCHAATDTASGLSDAFFFSDEVGTDASRACDSMWLTPAGDPELRLGRSTTCDSRRPGRGEFD